MFSKYDVLLSNWNGWGKGAAVTNWPPATRDALLNFLRAGKGLVVVHAGSSSFYDWPEYQQAVGASWKLGQTSHNKPHEFTVKAVANHPITQGLAPFRTTDELWLKPGLDSAATVLAVGGDQPVALVAHFGRGRTFTLLMGHDASFMENPGFQTLLMRGTEWAATGKVTSPDPEKLLKRITGYHYGDDRSALFEVERAVQTAPAEWAPKLAALLGGTATPDCKKFVCRQLSLCGTAAEVPALAKLLNAEEFAFAARGALERIPGEESLAALRAALATATGKTRTGLIDSLGARRDAKAVPLLVRLLPDPAAATALGDIGTQSAADALQKVHAPDALLRCAERLQSELLFEKLCAPDNPPAVRTAAFQARMVKNRELLLAGLKGSDPIIQEAAVAALHQTQDVKALQAAARLSVMPPALLTVLAEAHETSALPAATRAVASEDPALRRAAIRAIGALGDASSVPVLVHLLEHADQDERKLVTDALARMRGLDVDAALVKASRPETIRALVERGAQSSVPALVALAQNGNGDAIAALGKLADDSAPIIDLLDKVKDRDAVESALIAIHQRTGKIQPLIEAAAKADEPRKASLLTVLGALGGKQALAVLRNALKGDDAEAKLAAVRALSNWGNAAPLEDLRRVATTASDARLKALAERGVAQLEALGFDPRGYPNLARQAVATNPDGLKPDGAGGPPAAAVDGNLETYWDEVDNQKLYQLRVQMKQAATVRAIRITGWAHHSFSPKDFDVLCDGKVVKSIKGAEYQDKRLLVVLPATRCATIQLNITGYYPKSPAIRELEIFGDKE